jgi:RimJ/RimL family protein N-acetyltransferase
MRQLTSVDAQFLALESARQTGHVAGLAILDPSTAEPLGAVALSSTDLRHRRSGMGYWLAERARGRGIATEAVRLLAGWAFRVLRLDRLEVMIHPENVASQRVAERCGFKREGLRRSHKAGMAICRPPWRDRREETWPPVWRRCARAPASRERQACAGVTSVWLKSRPLKSSGRFVACARA